MNKRSIEFSVGLFVLIGLLCLGYLTIKLGKMEVFSNTGYTLSARFPSITGLKVGANVEIAGVPVGKVASISLQGTFAHAEDGKPGATFDDFTGYVADVVLLIDKGIILGEDSIASIKTNGLIGDKYVSISPGASGDQLEQGNQLTETEGSIDIEALISKYVFGGV